MADLTAEGLEKLLQRLDPDLDRAAERYEILRLKMVKLLVWKGCPDSAVEDLADETLTRIAHKLDEGVEIGSLNAYASQICRYVWLEFRRQRSGDLPVQSMPELQTGSELPEETDIRFECLKKCLQEITGDGTERELIIGYYDNEPGEKPKEARRVLAEKFGMKMNALKVRACRLRTKLEICITDCIAQ